MTRSYQKTCLTTTRIASQPYGTYSSLCGVSQEILLHEVVSCFGNCSNSKPENDDSSSSSKASIYYKRLRKFQNNSVGNEGNTYYEHEVGIWCKNARSAFSRLCQKIQRFSEIRYHFFYFQHKPISSCFSYVSLNFVQHFSSDSRLSFDFP